MAYERFVDIIAPDSVGVVRIDLELSTETPIARENDSVFVVPSYARTVPEGVVLPLIYTVTDPEGNRLVERRYIRKAPSLLEFVPNRGGRFLVRIGELFHNRWFGSLVVEVVGDLRII